MLIQVKFAFKELTLNLLTWTKWWAPASASKWHMGFNSAFKGLKKLSENHRITRVEWGKSVSIFCARA